MPTLPDPSGSGETHPDVTDDLPAWRAHIRALAAAASGITQATAAWDAVSDSYCDTDGWPIDEKGYADGKVARDAAAWKQVEVFLDHGPEVLAGVRAAARGTDYVEGPISEDLSRLRGIDTTLARASQIRHGWDQVVALVDASPPGAREVYVSRAQEIRNSEGWHYATELEYQGAALARAAEHLASRPENDRTAAADRVQAALARSAPDAPAAATAPAPTPPAMSDPPATRRSR
ncbi:hypothetical protein ABZ832_12375 [Streptantibioticus parmotrematis]|uniref:hypothetical protein n=1 Tax=Streptantibioticus parmotrematis TaxID=2873249 RepID=UPI0034008B03